MANKKTKREFFGELRILAEGNEELTNFIDHEVSLLDKKATAKRKVNDEQVALMATIKEELAKCPEPVTVTGLQTASPALEGYTNQRLTAMLKKLVDTKEVEKIVDKKKSYFKIA